MRTSIGWKAGPEQYPPQELLEYAIAAEEAGFESIDASDHFHPWSEEGQASFIWAWLGAVAARTRTIELGTGLTCPILRYHPSVIAQAAATLGALAPGRFYLAVGTGEALNEYSATAQWPSFDERRERLAESIALIRELWTGKPTTTHGKYYQTREAKLYTRSPQPIPLLVSTMTPESATFAGEQGDGLLTVGGKQPEDYQRMLANFEQGARKAGKDLATMRRSIELTVAFGDDEQAEMREYLRYWAGTAIPAMYTQNLYTPTMSQQNGAVVGPDTVKQKGCFSGKADDHIEYLRSYQKLGFTHLYVHYAGPDQAGFLRRYGREVLPHARLTEGSDKGHETKREPAHR